MKERAYIHLSAFEDDEGNIHYSSSAEGNSVDLTLLVAYLYYDQKELVETAIQDEVQFSLKNQAQDVRLN